MKVIGQGVVISLLSSSRRLLTLPPFHLWFEVILYKGNLLDTIEAKTLAQVNLQTCDSQFGKKKMKVPAL